MNLKIESKKTSVFFWATVILFLLGANIYLLSKEKRDTRTAAMQELSEMLFEQVSLASPVYHSYHNNKIDFDKKFPILIYRYSDGMCDPCLHEDFKNLNDFQKKIGEENILVVPAFPEDRNNMIRLKNELASFNYKNIAVELLHIPTDESEVARRYFAIIDTEGNLEMVFFPRKGHTHLTRSYFTAVEKRIKSLRK